MVMFGGGGTSLADIEALHLEYGGWQLATKTVTFVAGTTGAMATHALFTVTGQVECQLIPPYCSTSLTSGGTATIDLGVTGATTIISGTYMAQFADATTWDAGEWWSPGSADDADPGFGGPLADAVGPQFAVSADISYTIGGATITGGVAVFRFRWRPLSAGASLVAA